MRKLPALLFYLLPLTAAAEDAVLAARKVVMSTWPDAQISTPLITAACDGPVTAEAPQDARNGVAQVRVRCLAANGWTRFIALQITAPASLLVTTVPLAKGQLVSPANIRVESRDRFQSPADAVLDTQTLQGQMARRDLPAGTVITSSLFTAPVAITRGQTVTLRTSVAGIEVSAPGEALSDAAMGSRIKVRNSNSRRVVEGIARGNSIVEVAL